MSNLELLNLMQGGGKRKLYITIAVCVVVIILVIFIYKKYDSIKGLIVDEAANAKLVEEANKSIVASDITIPQDQFSAYATKLQDAMEGWGTDEDAIYSVFKKMNTRSDVLQLVKTFGTRDGETLSEWLHDDLSSSEMNKVNSILSEKGINYQF